MMIKLLYNMIYRGWPRPAMWDIAPGNDPMSHPAVRAMDPDELADLPFASMRCRNRG